MNKRINIYLLIIIIVMALGITSVITITLFSNKEETPKVEEKKSGNNPYNYDYKYILAYDYLTENFFIYLLNDDSVKVVKKERVIEECFEQNCMHDTGETRYVEMDTRISDEALVVVRNVVSTFFAVGDVSEIDLASYNLDDRVKLVLNGLIQNNSDMILLKDSIKIDHRLEKLNNNKGEIVFVHSYNSVVDSDNIIVKNIGEHINKIIKKDYDEVIKDSKDMLEDVSPEDSLGVDFSLNIETITDDEVSMTYTTEGGMGGVAWYVVRGYVYSTSNGKVMNYRENKKQKALEAAIEKFEKSELYLQEKDQLVGNYKQVLEKEIFEIGNFYVTDKDVVFVIDGYLLGFDEATAKVVEIKIEKANNF